MTTEDATAWISSFQNSLITPCVNCGDTSGEFILDYALGDYICGKCGVVQPEHVIDSGADWNEYENDEGSTNKARGEKVDDDLNSLGTQISATTFGSNVQTQQIKTLSKYSKIANSETTNKRDLYLREAFARVNELAEKLQLSHVIKQTAKDIVKQFEKKRDKIVKGYKKDSFLVAVIVLACKLEQGGRTLKGLARSTNIEEKEIKRFYKMLIRDSSLTSMGDRERTTTAHQVLDLVEVICNKLQLPYNIAKDSKEVAAKANNFLEGKRPSSIAAASIFFILNFRNLPLRAHELANVAGISINTLRNVSKELVNNIDQLPAELFPTGESLYGVA